MSWASHAISQLASGQNAVVTPRGNSMSPRVISGAKVMLMPNTAPEYLKKDDIVLVRIKGRVYLHLISATDSRRVQIANARGRVNGWVSREKPYGVVVAVENP